MIRDRIRYAEMAADKVRDLQAQIQEQGKICVVCTKSGQDGFGGIHTKEGKCPKYEKYAICQNQVCRHQDSKAKDLALQRRLRNLKHIRNRAFLNVLFVTRKPMQLCRWLYLRQRAIEKSKEFERWADKVEGMSTNNKYGSRVSDSQYAETVLIKRRACKLRDLTEKRAQEAKNALLSWTK